MASQLETIGGLERRLNLAVSSADIASRVQERFRSLAKSVRMPGFRPGKVPLKMIQQSYGHQVHSEVVGDMLTKAFGDAVREHKLRVAGQPEIAPRAPASPEGNPGAIPGANPDSNPDADSESSGFVATFEVYPDITLGSPEAIEVERFAAIAGDAEVARTIETLRKQRTQWHEVTRASAEGDRVTVDFVGTIDGVAFDNGSAQNAALVLGEGRMLPDFEAGVTGKSPGETAGFEVTFPADYNAKELADKTARFEVTVNKVEQGDLPALDAAFAVQMGVGDGNLDKFLADVRANLEREVAQRVKGRTKTAVMDRLSGLAAIELPKALVEQESQVLAERMKADLKGRGVDVEKVPVPPEAFREPAERRVRLGLIVGEAVKQHGLQAKPEQIRKQIEEFAQTYENPAEVVRWYFSDRNRLAEVEALVVEQNVVDWMLSRAKVTERVLSFDELMAGS